MVEYTLLRGNRRTIAIVITPQGRVEVRTPPRLPREYADGFVRQKERWIKARLREWEEALPFSPATGALLPLAGGDCPVVYDKDASAARFDGGCFYLPAPPPKGTLAQIEALYRTLARALCERLLNERADALSLPYGGLRISGAKARWGSCNRENVIALSWRLAALPPQTAGYVITHELCHTRHRDHGAGFRAMLRGCCPDYSEREEELRRWAIRLACCYTLLQNPRDAAR